MENKKTKLTISGGPKKSFKNINNQKNHGGLILFVDEMGKLLEAASDGDGDVYFYQLLAEAATRSNGRFVIIGILHQSFQDLLTH